MSDPAQDILKQMKKDNAKLAGGGETGDVYSKIFVFPHIRRRLLLACVVFFAVAMNFVLRDTEAGRSWLITALPLTALGLLMTLLPPTETWDYRPWQSRSRQYEKHQTARER